MKKYHTLYVPHELWQEVIWKADEQIAKKPTEVALDYIRYGLTAGRSVLKQTKPPSERKNNKKKKEIVKELLLLCMYTGDYENPFKWVDNPDEVRQWKLFCTKMGHEAEFAKCFVTEAASTAVIMDEDAPCKHFAEMLYHSWNDYNEKMDEEREAFK